MTTVLTPAAPPAGTTAGTADGTADSTARRATAPVLTRAGAAALVLGAALNTGQALLMRALGGGDTGAEQLADVDAHPVATLAMILGGLVGVVLLLVGFRAVAAALRPSAPRAAGIGSVLTFVGTLGFLGMHVLMLVTYALAGLDDRAAAITVLDHLAEAPLLLVVFAPFLLGMFGGLLALTVGLFRTAGVPRWIPAVWALFLPIDLAAGGAGPVDAHWLFVAGAVGLAVTGRRAAKA